MNRFFRYLQLVFVTISAANASADQYPAYIRSVLARHQVWQTIVYAHGSATDISKKWQMQGNSQSAQKLIEITDLSIGVSEKDGKLQWQSNTVDLTSAILSKDFYFQGMFETNSEFSFRLLSKDRIEIKIKSDSGTKFLLFVPSMISSPPVTVWAQQPVNVWTAPLRNAGAFERAFHLTKKSVAYLQHDLSSFKEVLIDESFPEKFRPSVERVLGTWNAAFGHEFFRLLPGKSKADLADCYSSNRICFFWSGSEKIPWSGTSATSDTAFDPQSGLILGGIVEFLNPNSDPRLLTKAPQDDDLRITTGQIDYEWIVSRAIRSAEFHSYESPIPDRLVEGLLLHELGHCNGFSHNFAGSLNGTASQPSASIMDYVSFASAGQAVYLGEFDLEMIALVYKHQQPSWHYVLGTDEQMGEYTSSDQRWVGANAADLGDPAKWYVSLSKASASGVFAPYKSKDVLSKLIDFIDSSFGASEAQISMVRSYLCSQTQVLPQIQARFASIGRNLQCL